MIPEKFLKVYVKHHLVSPGHAPREASPNFRLSLQQILESSREYAHSRLQRERNYRSISKTPASCIKYPRDKQ